MTLTRTALSRLIYAPGRRWASTKQFSTKNGPESTTVSPSELRPPKSSLDQHRRPMKSFMKELFMGRVNTVVFSYPDVLDNARYFDLHDRCERAGKILRSHADKAENDDQVVDHELLAVARSLGYFSEADCVGESVTESLRYQEELCNVNASFSEAVASAAYLGQAAVAKFGTEAQRAKYGGDLVGSLCLSDDNSGADFSAPATIALLAGDDSKADSFVIRGRKTWVTNGPLADYFVVSAGVMSKDEAGTPRPKLTLFLVDKGAKGVTVEATSELAGLKGLQTCSVSFNNVELGSDAVVGEVGKGQEVVVGILETDKLGSAARITAMLRRMLSATVRYALGKRSFNRPLMEFELIQERLANCAVQIFALESAVYMTAGMADYQTQPDVSLESAAMKRLAVRTSALVSEACSSILGARTYLENDPYRKLAEDLRGLRWWEGTDEMLGLYVGASGVAYAGVELQEEVRVQRNPLFYPMTVIARGFKDRHVRSDRPRLTLRLGDHLHPSLSAFSDRLEYFVHRFRLAVEALLIRDGANAVVKEVDLVRLADVAVDIFVMASALARASRSLCGGHPHMDHEVELATTFIKLNDARLKSVIDDAINASELKSDPIVLNIAKQMATSGGYVPCHPITKNTF